MSAEAIARATELRPHLVIMDYTMPHVNGLEATGEIHRALPERLAFSLYLL